ncbi:MAG: N-acetylmuramoyl-L-alanine amidase [Candidatus Limnocylindria bacterium]
MPTVWNHDRGRHGEPVRYIIIHYTAISYERTLRAFNNPNSRVSAHYVVRGDGHITQMVGEADTAWHAGHYWYNQRSVGIEIELDPVTNPVYTVEQYHATAALACAIAARHGIPLDRVHVVGHNEIPNTGKIDPGPTWGWPHFMWLTSLCAPATAATVQASWVSQTEDLHLRPGETGDVSVVLRNTGATAWQKGTPHEARLAIPGNDTSLAFLAAGWPTADRVATQVEEFVPPGATATFTFRVRGAKPGTFVVPLRGVIDGGAWMPDFGIHTRVVVRPSADASLP